MLDRKHIIIRQNDKSNENNKEAAEALINYLIKEHRIGPHIKYVVSLSKDRC